MSEATNRLDALIDEYLRGNERFMRFWTAFMDCWAQADLSEAELGIYGEAYDVVYMGADGPVAPRDTVLGLLSETEVRARLRDFRTRRSGASPA